MDKSDSLVNKYTRLNSERLEIRLLHIHPAGHPTYPIECHFSIASLGAAKAPDHDLQSVQYEAISYVWGSDLHKDQVKVNGVPVKVTVNLHWALQALRLADKERTIWVDAICIDQNNLIERTEQVAMMRNIYERAQSVVIWLGQAWEDCHLVMRYLESMGQHTDLHIQPSVTPSLHVDKKDITSAEIQGGLKRFFGFAWWTRVWTVQEWILARRSVFQCGQYLLDGQLARKGVRNYFHHLESCCSGLMHECPNHSSVFKDLITMETVEYIRLLLGKVTLPYILSQFRSREATNVCDKVYGMLGLARGQYEHIIRPDYLLPVEKIFEYTTLEIVRRTGSLEIMSHIPTDGQKNLDLPSFVPDWSVSAKDDYYYTDWLNWIGHLHLYHACGEKVADLQIIGPGSIALKGMKVDEIELIGPVPSDLTRSTFLHEIKTLAVIGNTFHPCQDDAQKNENMSTFWSAICGTIEKYLDPSRDNRPFYRRISPPTSHQRFEAWASWYVSDIEHNLMTPDVLSVHRPFKTISVGRRFAVTKKGRLVWCPVKSKRGDIIAVLGGGTVPFILRPGERESYSIVGDSYVQGIMDGEALTEGLDSGQRFEFIKLT